MPNYITESRAGGRVAGIDEAGRGPLAGPVLAAAVVLGPRLPRGLGKLLDDSKKLSAAQRLEAFHALVARRNEGKIEIGVGAASVGEITRVNILQASLLSMHRAVSRLAAPPDLAIVDGNRPPTLDCPVRCVIGGDAECFSIAAASIIAKVLRDRAMTRLSIRWPGYGWESNAGYGTTFHRAALIKLGPTRHHRPTFGLVRQMELLPLLDRQPDPRSAETYPTA